MANENIGAVVENLIRIKDNCTLSPKEEDAINYACNILDNCFNQQAVPNLFIKNNVMSIHISVEWVVKELGYYGFVPSQENVDILLAFPEFKEEIRNRIEAATTQAIFKTIMDCRNELEIGE